MSAPSASARQEVPIADSTALTEMRRRISASARLLGFGLVEQTKLITAASELGRNMLHHAGCGVVLIDTVEEGSRMGLRITFSDQGPGIDDVDLAMKDGYTSAKGMGLGLPGARRLAHEFSIETAPGEGTTVVIAMWRR